MHVGALSLCRMAVAVWFEQHPHPLNARTVRRIQHAWVVPTKAKIVVTMGEPAVATVILWQWDGSGGVVAHVLDTCTWQVPFLLP